MKITIEIPDQADRAILRDLLQEANHRMNLYSVNRARQIGQWRDFLDELEENMRNDEDKAMVNARIQEDSAEAQRVLNTSFVANDILRAIIDRLDSKVQP